MMCELSVVILCGGLGTRLRSEIGNEIPKILAPIGNKYFLEYLINWVNNLLGEINYEVILCLGYGQNKILNVIKKLDIKVQVSAEETQLGTFPAVLDAAKVAKSKRLLIINGDTLFKMNIKELIGNFDSKSYLCIKKNNSIKKQKNGYEIDLFTKKLKYSENFPEYISVGAFLINKSIINTFKKDRSNIPQLLDKELISKIEPYPIYLKSNCDFIDIGTKENYKLAQKFLPEFYPLN